MTITVEYFAQLRTATDIQSETYALDAPVTLATLTNAMRERHPDALGSMLGSDGELPGWITVVVSGNTVRDAQSVIPEQATVRFLSPISGG